MFYLLHFTKIKTGVVAVYMYILETYRVFEPGYPDDPDHDAPDDGPQAQQHELGGGVALVGGAVGARALGGGARTLRRDPVITNLAENTKEQ